MAKGKFWKQLGKFFKAFFTLQNPVYDFKNDRLYTGDQSDDWMDDYEINNSVEYDGEPSTVLGNLVDKYTGSGLTDAEQEANDFTAQLQEDQQAYNAAEAEKAYQREVDFYEKYTSPKAQMSQLIEAGVNPFAAGGAVSGGSNLSGPVASSGAGGSVAPHGADLAGLIGVFSQLAGLKADVDLKGAQADNIRANTAWIDALNSAALRMSDAQIQGILKDIEVKGKEIEVADSVIEVNASQVDINKATEVLRNMESDQIRQLLPFIRDLKLAETEDARASAAVKIAQTALVGEQTQRTDTGEKLDVANTVIDGVTDVVTTGVLIGDIIGEVFGVEDAGQRWSQTRQFERDSRGRVTKVTDSGSGSKKTTKKSRRRRRR